MSARSSTARRSPREVRARGGERGRGVRAAAPAAAGPRDGAGRRRPGLGRLRRRQAARVRRGRDDAVRRRLPRRRGVRRRSPRSCDALNEDDGGQRDPAAAAGAGAPRRRRADGADRPEKDVDGLTPVNAGLLSLGRPGLRPCTPLGVMELLARDGRRAGGRRGGGRRALEPVRQADGAAAARRERDASRSATRARATCAAVCARADVLIAAVGRPRLIGARLRQARRGRDRRRHEPPHPEEAGNKSGLVGDVDFAAAVGGRLGDHAGPRRGRPDDDRVAAAQHAAGRACTGRDGAAMRSQAVRHRGSR